MYINMEETIQTKTGMIDKYSLLLTMKALDYEIKELTGISKSCCECYTLLKDRIEKLCRFMTNKDNERKWRLYGDHEDVKIHAELLRESSMQALCDIEKYHSHCIFNQKLNINGYLSALSGSVKEELVRYGINENSRVLFIGAGAFPVSALTIAKETGASVLGLDIDDEAVQLASRVAKVSGLKGKVSFSGSRVHELSYAQEATHVIVASLVKNKLELLYELKPFIRHEAKIVLRFGNGLKSVFNYPLEVNLEDEWISSTLPPCGALYDTLVLKKSASESNR